ncbi:MAG TPA: 5'-methylthioadenosine/adenosylhomocysteine nucleosidase [Bacilli bacterium]
MTTELKKYGLIGAMDEEIELMLKGVEQMEKTVKAGIHFYEGFFLSKEIVLCKSGVGKVNAAICTQILIDLYKVDAIIFTGVAGALHPSLEIGDMVISADCMHHDMDVTSLGFPRGTIPYETNSIFAADPALIQAAYESSQKVLDGFSMIGRVLSGDQFITNRDLVQYFHEDLGGACTEMEGAAVAQVCSKNDIPFVVIRSMSDKADGSAHVNFVDFTVKASRHSYNIVEEMFRSL